MIVAHRGTGARVRQPQAVRKGGRHFGRVAKGREIELPQGGGFSSLVPADFNGFVYLLEGEARFGGDRHPGRRSQIAVLGPGGVLAVEAQPGTRILLMAGKPYGETPINNGPYVD